MVQYTRCWKITIVKLDKRLLIYGIDGLMPFVPMIIS